MGLEKKVSGVCVKVLGKLYLKAEKYLLTYDQEILGVAIDKDLVEMERVKLCSEFDKSLHKEPGAFYQLPSTHKIRIGVQVMRNYEHEEEGRWNAEFRRKLKDKKGCRYAEKKWPKPGHSGL